MPEKEHPHPYIFASAKTAGIIKTALIVLMVALAASNFGLAIDINKLEGYQKTPPPLLGSENNLGNKISLLLSDQITIAIGANGKQFFIQNNEISKWTEMYFRNYTDREEYRFDNEKIRTYVENLAPEINEEPINARLVFKENGQIAELLPAQNGSSVDIEKSAILIMATLAGNGNHLNKLKISLPIKQVSAAITKNRAETLGIATMIGSGESNFSGSSQSRIENIKVSSEILNGLVIKPGEEFSFNTALGPVDASSGYVPELVIKDGKLIPEYGGGICQVSTTLFRAAMKAGLPVLERHAHSLPVRYYNPQGFDATVYPGVSDLRLKNDTPNYILVQSKVSEGKLEFFIYGTDDKRTTTINGPVPYDIQENGALKAILKRTVIYPDGREQKDSFFSSYKSPSLFPTVRNPLE